MAHTTAAKMATRDRKAARYQRHRPEQTLLYRIIEQHYPEFTAHSAVQGTVLPAYWVATASWSRLQGTMDGLHA